MADGSSATAALAELLDRIVPPDARVLRTSGAIAIPWARPRPDGTRAGSVVLSAHPGRAPASWWPSPLDPEAVGPADVDSPPGWTWPVESILREPRHAGSMGRDRGRAMALASVAAQAPAPALLALDRHGLHDHDGLLEWFCDPVDGPAAIAFAEAHPWLAAYANADGLARLHVARGEHADAARWAVSRAWWAHGPEVAEAVDALAGMPFMGGSGDHVEMGRAMASAAAMPRAMRPPTPDPGSPSGDPSRQAVLAFREASFPILSMAAVTGRSPRSVAGRMASWDAYARVLSDRTGFRRDPEDHPMDRGRAFVADAMGSVDDMMAAFAAEVLAPAAVEVHGHAALADLRRAHGSPMTAPHSPLMAGAIRVLLGRRSLPVLCEVAAGWHRHGDKVHRLLMEIAGDDAPAGPCLFGPTDLGEGLTAVCLHRVQDLMDEGAHGRDAVGAMGLDHCVASYFDQVATGATAIVSIRRLHGDGTYERVSTAEVDLAPGQGRRLVQHRGRSNAETPAWLDAFVSRFLDRIAPQAGAALSAHRPVPGGMSDPAILIHRERAWERVRDLWSHALTRPQRSMGQAEMLGVAGLLPSVLHTDGCHGDDADAA